MKEHVGRLLRVGVEVAEEDVVAAAQRRSLVVLSLDSAEPLGHVPLPDRLPELAVVDDVEADLHLLPDDVGDGAPEFVLAHLAEERGLGRGRPLERPNVGRQDPVGDHVRQLALEAHALTA